MRLLHIDSAITGSNSVSREVSAAIVAKLTTPGTTVTTRDLVAENIPHLTFATMPGDHPASAYAGPLDAAQQALRDNSQAMLDEFLASDTVVIGAPMYNFTVPSQLKAWIDRIVVAGKTFNYGATGPVGLVPGKRVIVAIARGGTYGPGSAAASVEHAETYLRDTFGFLGIRPEFIVVEGLALGGDAKAAAVAAAHDAVAQLATERLAA